MSWFYTAGKHRYKLVPIVLLILAGCTASSVYISPFDRTSLPAAPPSIEELKHEVYLIGDAGGSASSSSEPTLRLLQRMTQEADSNGTVVFLGDNVYCCGLPDSSSSSRAFAEMRLRAQLDAVKNYKGRVVFVPGNHDWGRGSTKRVDLVNRQEEFVESYLNNRNAFLPDNGLPGPVEVKLEDNLYLIVLDTEWWMTGAVKPYGDSGSADIKEDADLILELQEIVTKRRKDDLVVVAHHPIRSNGRHGGHFSIKDHLFPLTALKDGWYVPLPIIGSLYPILRRAMGGPQDFSHPKYRSLISALDAIFKTHESRLIYAAGHEHNLQYFYEDHVHHVVSGAGSKSDYVAAGRNARFTYGGKGFIRIRFYANGEMWLEAWGSDENTPEGRLLYHAQIEGPAPEVVTEPIIVEDEQQLLIPPDSTVRRAANPSLAAGGLHNFFFGSENRKAWTAEVDFPVFDIGSESGGLTPIKRGGGLQTTSLRLRDSQGKQFVLRSVSKDPTKSLPPGLEETLAANIVVDQYAILHPYAPIVVPKLAHGAGVYHTNPKIFLVPKDDRFGPFRDVVADQIMLFEERPDDDMSHAPTFGRSKKVIGSVSMTKKIASDNDYRVDERFFARARLFDMYISDWDRHSDQWRWAEFPAEGSKGKRYRAIPRDRDWAMSRMNGIFPSIAKSRFVLAKNQDFRESYGYIRGLTRNGRPQDRRFTTSLTRSDWLEIARDIQDRVTDEVIDSAVSDFPEPILKLYADEFRHLLRVRREKLPDAAEEYYEIISRFPDVVGSNKHERFEIQKLSGDRTEVVMYKTSKEGEIRKELFRRIFLGSETKEVRLYGLGGNDVFIVSGNAKGGIRIRAIGGTGADQFIDKSGPLARRNSFVVYDVPFETQIQLGPAISVQVSDDPLVNRYDPREYGYPEFMPSLFFGRNQDDGLFIGGGTTFTRYSFRRPPFDNRHSFRANLAARTQAFNVAYEGRFTNRLNGWDIGVEASIRTPNNIRNYYGLGNESPNTAKDARFYQARFSETVVGIRFIKPVGGFLEFYVGPRLEGTDIKKDSLRFVGLPQAGIAPTSFGDESFLGFESGIKVDVRDSAVFPRQGFFWENRLHLRFGLHESTPDFTEISSDFSLYLTPVSLTQHTFAARVGVRHNIGEFPFYRSSTLGGRNNLRGWRSTRFAGRTAFYQSFEIRTQLFDTQRCWPWAQPEPLHS
ncbi:MAG: metallophosphoesterase [Rhodothermia bacterium]|nr:MAG: metallophosphoesterase [Rhodothermia bacterium]